jgi:predicted enzyme related to lactoylglutathione lyase
MRVLVNIDVPDLRPAIDFYCAALGLQLSRLLDDDVAELTGASSMIYLLRKDAESSPKPGLATGRDYARHWTPVHMDFVVDDLTAATGRALAAGAVRENHCIDWRGSRCVTFSDPFGHGFCLIAFSGTTYTDSDSDSGGDDPGGRQA